MRATFDQDAAKAALGEHSEDRGGRDLTGARGNLRNFNILWQRGPDAFGGDNKPPRAVCREYPCVGWEPAARIENDTRGARAGDASDGKLRIISDGRPDPDQDRIHQSAEPVQMRQTSGPIDVFGMAGDRRDAAVDGLADLPDHNKVVDRSLPQWPEAVFPWMRQRTGSGSKIAWNLEPIERVTGGVIRLNYVSHVFTAGFTSNGKMRELNTMFFGD